MDNLTFEKIFDAINDAAEGKNIKNAEKLLYSDSELTVSEKSQIRKLFYKILSNPYKTCKILKNKDKARVIESEEKILHFQRMTETFSNNGSISLFESYKFRKDAPLNFIKSILNSSHLPGGVKKEFIWANSPAIYKEEYKKTLFPSLFNLYNNGDIQAFELIGKSKFKKISTEELWSVVSNKNFSSEKIKEFSGDVYSDVNVKATINYHSKILNDEIIKKLIDIVLDESYPGYLDLDELMLRFKKKVKPDKLDISPETKLLLKIY